MSDERLDEEREELLDELEGVAVEESDLEGELPEGYISDKEEFERRNPGKKWRDPKTFKELGSYYKRIDTLERQAKMQRVALEELVKEKELMAQRQRQAELRNISAAKEDAVARGDLERYSALEKEFTERVIPSMQPQVEQYTKEEIEAALEFKARNPQLAEPTLDNEEAVLYIESAYKTRKKYYPEKSPKELLAEIEVDVAQKFPRLLKNSKREQSVMPVDGQSASSASSKSSSGGLRKPKLKYSELNDRQKAVYQSYKELGRDPVKYLLALEETYGVR